MLARGSLDMLADRHSTGQVPDARQTTGRHHCGVLKGVLLRTCEDGVHGAGDELWKHLMSFQRSSYESTVALQASVCLKVIALIHGNAHP